MHRTENTNLQTYHNHGTTTTTTIIIIIRKTSLLCVCDMYNKILFIKKHEKFKNLKFKYFYLGTKMIPYD